MFKWRKRMPWFTAFAAACPNKVIQTPLLEEESVESTKAHLNRGISVLKSVGHSNESTHPLPLMDTCIGSGSVRSSRRCWCAVLTGSFPYPGGPPWEKLGCQTTSGCGPHFVNGLSYKWILNPLLSGMHITPYIPGGVSPVLGPTIWAAQGQTWGKFIMTTVLTIHGNPLSWIHYCTNNWGK